MATPSEDSLKNLADTYAKGVTLAVLANQFGVSIPTVTKWVRNGGGVIRSRGQRKKGTVVTTTAAPVEVTDTVETFEPRNPCAEIDVNTEVAPRQIFQAEV